MFKPKLLDKKQRPLVLAISLLAIGIGLLVVFTNQPEEEPATTSSGPALQVIENPGSDPRQQQATGSTLQGAARVNDLAPNGGSSLQQGQGIQQAPSSTDDLLKDKTIN